MVSEVDRIAKFLRSNLKLEGELILSGPIYSGSNSVIYRGDGDAFPFPVAIKKCLSPVNTERSAAEDCALQYAALEKVSKAMSSTKTTSTPQPVAQVKEKALLIIEWVEGRSLTNMFRNGHVSGPNIANAVEKAGGWLGAFHRSHLLTSAPVDTIWAFGMLEEALEAAPESFKRRRYVRTGVDLLRSFQTRIDEIDIPVSWVHGDFKSDNILLAADRTVGLDTGANFENTTLLDISHFLNHLEILLLDPRNILHLPRRNTLISRFEFGYGKFPGDMAVSANWFRLLAAIRQCAELQCQERSLFRRFDDLRYCWLIRHLTKDLDRK